MSVGISYEWNLLFANYVARVLKHNTTECAQELFAYHLKANSEVALLASIVQKEHPQWLDLFEKMRLLV